MQFIHKNNLPPNNWDNWFVDGNNTRSHDFRLLPTPHQAKEFLLIEQKGLCAYCQKKIEVENASIEHVIPYSQNMNLSTIYYNLVIVCQNFITDSANKKHCDKARGKSLLPPIIFHKDFSFILNDDATYTKGEYCKLFIAEEDGTLNANTIFYNDTEGSLYLQVLSFIAILHLNHDNLKAARVEFLKGWEMNLIGKTVKQQKAFWSRRFADILGNLSHPYRQFLLIYLDKKIKQSGKIK